MRLDVLDAEAIFLGDREIPAVREAAFALTKTGSCSRAKPLGLLHDRAGSRYPRGRERHMRKEPPSRGPNAFSNVLVWRSESKFAWQLGTGLHLRKRHG